VSPIPAAPAASILIPSHNRAESLTLAVESALAQTVRDVEVLIIGDGVTAPVRAAAHALESDPRVHFLDYPKGESHGETYRHDAIGRARSDAIMYLCDDDLLLRDHVADLLELLESHNFVQSLNGWITPDGAVGHYPANLADPDTIVWHAADWARYNLVSITGTAHSKTYYDVVGDPWSATPDDEWPDHHQWRKFFRRADFRGATSARMTALQFPTSGDGRGTWSEEERLQELRSWADFVRRPDAQEQLDKLVALGAISQLERLSKRLARAELERDRAQAELDAITASRSWTLTGPFRAARRTITRAVRR